MKNAHSVLLAAALAAVLPAHGAETWSVGASGNLASMPLVLQGSVPPNVMFALSVEFPTANTAAYQGASDYTAATEYLGLFDNRKCYTYDDANGWFKPAVITADGICGSGRWSGNFLNWATMTGLDEFRYAMTGGNRYRDTATETVVERTYQSGQGGTGNFTNKTFKGSGATPYLATDTITIVNQGKGVQMQVTPSGTSDTANCSGPALDAGKFSCTLTLVSNGETGSCSTWSGAGTSGDPYNCAKANVSFAAGTPTVWTPGTKSNVNIGGTAAKATCSAPSYSGGVFSCGSLTLDTGESGTCATWSGSGTDPDPFTCTTFGTFDGKSFSGTRETKGSVDVAGTAQQTDNNPTCTGNAKASIGCNLSNGSTSTCTITSGNGTNGNPYRCGGSSVWTFSGSESLVSRTNADNGTKLGTYYYRVPVQIVYNKPVTNTYYYAAVYSGSVNATNYYYYSTYTAAFGSAKTFNVRVKVCDPTVGLEGNCKRYGDDASPSYKPTGVVQDNGDTMRFGVTSYFQANDVDNAVLRAKAKYVAPKKWSEAGLVTNTAAEWSGTDGTLVTDPDSGDAATHNSYIGTTTNSGVINYINKFGSNSHSYKTYDVLGKLYYETLNYLTGSKSPTTAFYNGATAANADSFPVISNWDDPVLYSCQKNYIIAMGDTHTWCDKRLPGGTYTTTNNGVCNAYNDANGHAHPDDKGSLTGGIAVDVTSTTNWVGGQEGIGNIATTATGAGSSASFYLSGLAHWAAANDFRSDLIGRQTINTYIIDVQEYRDCGYRSQYWLAAKYGNNNAYDAAGDWLTTNNPAMQQSSLPSFGCGSRQPPWDDAAHTKVQWPKNLLMAGDPASMIASVKNAVASIAAQNGQLAVQGQSSSSLISGGAYVYQSTFNTEGWQGDLIARQVSTSAVLSSPIWQASTMLPTAENRVIYTFNDGLSASGYDESSDNGNARKGVLFTKDDFKATPSALSTRQRDFLNSDTTGTNDGYGPDRVNWLRGDKTNESPNGYGWRARTVLLGDIVNSAPIYVGPPRQIGLSGTGYDKHVAAVKNRTPVVYVGGNDGMLHGFDASPTGTSGHTPGKELMAFVPSSVYYQLNQLMWPDYKHRYFVDGSPTVAEVCTGSCSDTDGKDWKTVLVGGLRSGGKGIYALNVTDPSAFANTAAAAAKTVLWEFTSRDDNDLGYTFGTPQVRSVVVSVDTGTVDAENKPIFVDKTKWAVIFGNGYNNTSTLNTANGVAAVGEGKSYTGRAYIYIAFVDGPAAGKAWDKYAGDYVKIELKSPAEGTAPLDPPNGLARIAPIDSNGDGAVDALYAGDLHGNLWKIDLSSTDPSKWGSAYLTAGGDPKPLFTAKDKDGNAQPITGGIAVSRHPNGGYMVLFGTGSFAFENDSASATQQSLYGIWDQMDDDQTLPVTRSVLQQQKQLGKAVYDGATYLLQSDCSPNYSTGTKDTGDGEATGCPSDIMVADSAQQYGWFFDLPNTQERIVMDRLLLNSGILTVTSLAPASTDPCGGGSAGWRYDLDYLTGGRSGTVVYTTGVGKPDGLTITFNIGGESLSFLPSGSELKVGSDTPSQFQMAPATVPDNHLDDAAGGGGDPPPPPPPSEETPGNTFVRGWGLPFYMKRGGGGAGQGGGNKRSEHGTCASISASLFPGYATLTGGCSQGEGVVSWRQLAQ